MDRGEKKLLKHFQVPEEDAVRVRHDTLRTTVEEIFRKVGLSEDDAVLGAGYRA